MNVAPVTGRTLLTASVPPSWSNVGAPPAIDRLAPAAIVKLPSLTTWPLIDRLAPAVIVTLPALTTWPLIVVRPPAP